MHHINAILRWTRASGNRLGRLMLWPMAALLAVLADAKGRTPVFRLRLRQSLTLASSALLTSAPLLAQPLQEPTQDAMAFVQQAIEAKGTGNHAAALDAYAKAAAILAEDPAQQNGWGLLMQADLQRDIARTAHAAGVGDPCPSLDRSKVLLDRARIALTGEGKEAMVEAMVGMEQALKDEHARVGCGLLGQPAQAGKPDAALVGHYYLSGVRETGSELLLKPDGRFEWFISYGAVDQTAKGRWSRDGQGVTLTADLPSADAPLVRAGDAMPWNEEAERRLRYAIWSRKADAVAARCPWGAGVAAAPSVYLPEERPPAGTVELAKAAATKAAAERARDEAARAVIRAVVAGASEDDGVAADTAMNAWHSASYEMELAYRGAGLPVPDIGVPAMPPECQYPARDDANKLGQEHWLRGVAALVEDPVQDLRLQRIGVTFVFSDGQRETAATDRGGWAFAAPRKGAVVQQLVVSIPQAGLAPVTLAVAPLGEGVQTVIVDTPQLAGPPFETLHLRVEGRDLIPADMSGGRYSRE